jgi:integrase
MNTGESSFLTFVETTGDPMSALWSLMLATGLRRGELLGLTWADVDLVDGFLNVVRSRGVAGVDTPKTKKGRRTISLDGGTVDALARWKDQHESAATLALQAGVPINVVSGRLGHEHVSTTLDVYAAYLPLADRDAASRIGQLLATNVVRDRQS